MFDLVEEPLNQIAGTVKEGTETDRFVTVASRWNVALQIETIF